MFNFKLPDFQPVVAGQTAMLKIPRYALTLNRLTLRMGGTFNKALMEKIEIKLGTRPVWSADSEAGLSAGEIVDKINKYKGLYDQASHLTIDFTERDFMNIAAREVGGWDMSKLADDLYINIKINAAAVAPTLYAIGYFTPPQGKDIEEGQLVQKLVAKPYSFASGGRQPINFDPKGALVKRIYAFFTTADTSTNTTEQPIEEFVVKKNRDTVHELSSTDNKFLQKEFQKVPQTQLYAVDFCVDNNLSGALVTADARSLEFEPKFAAGESGVLLFEVLDAPVNL